MPKFNWSQDTSAPKRLDVKESCAKTSASKRRRQNVGVKTSAPNYLVAKTSQRQNISTLKVARQKVLTAKCTHYKTYLRLSVLTTKFLAAKSPMAKFPTPKSPTAKIPYGKVSSLQNVPTAQCFSGKKSFWQSVPRRIFFLLRKVLWQNLRQRKVPRQKVLTTVSSRWNVLTAKCTNGEESPAANFFYCCPIVLLTFIRKKNLLPGAEKFYLLGSCSLLEADDRVQLCLFELLSSDGETSATVMGWTTSVFRKPRSVTSRQQYPKFHSGPHPIRQRDEIREGQN